MRVLHVCPLFPPDPSSFGGGVTQVVYNIGNQLVKRGHTVDVYTSYVLEHEAAVNAPVTKIGFRKSLFIDGLKVYYFPYLFHYYTFFVTPTVISSTIKSLKNYDIIHIHDPRSFQGIIISYFAKKFGIPYVVHAHGSFVKTSDETTRIVSKGILDWSFARKVIKNSSKVIALSSLEAKQYLDLGVDSKAIEIIPNGVDLSDYFNLPSKGVFKQKYSIPINKKLILYIGRITKSKGIDFLINAFATICGKEDFRDTLLVISGKDDGYLDELKNLVNAFRLADKVLLTGGLSKKEKISAFVDSSVVVNVEPRNVFGLVPLEAAACSTPVIVSKDNAISKIILEGKFGFAVKHSDVEELSNTLHFLLEDEKLQKEMGTRGRTFIFKNYDWDKIVSKIEKVYEHAIFNAQTNN